MGSSVDMEEKEMFFKRYRKSHEFNFPSYFKEFNIDGKPVQNIGKSVWQLKVGIKYQF